MTTDPTLPSIRAELVRKTAEELTALAHQVVAGTLTEAQAGVQAAAIWRVTAGLIDNDLSAIASDMAARGDVVAGKAKPTARHFWHQQSGVITSLIHMPGAAGFVVRKRTPGEAHHGDSRQVMKCDKDLVLGRIERVARHLTTDPTGYVELT